MLDQQVLPAINCIHLIQRLGLKLTLLYALTTGYYFSIWRLFVSPIITTETNINSLLIRHKNHLYTLDRLLVGKSMWLKIR